MKRLGHCGGSAHARSSDKCVACWERRPYTLGSAVVCRGVSPNCRTVSWRPFLLTPPKNSKSERAFSNDSSAAASCSGWSGFTRGSPLHLFRTSRAVASNIISYSTLPSARPRSSGFVCAHMLSVYASDFTCAHPGAITPWRSYLYASVLSTIGDSSICHDPSRPTVTIKSTPGTPHPLRPIRPYTAGSSGLSNSHFRHVLHFLLESHAPLPTNDSWFQGCEASRPEYAIHAKSCQASHPLQTTVRPVCRTGRVLPCKGSLRKFRVASREGSLRPKTPVVVKR
jgi:hypothetical protein